MIARIRSTSWAVIVAPTLGAFLFSADTITIQIANPRIGSSLHTGLDGLQWAANGFLLPFCVLLVAMGTLADKLGPRKVLLGGIAVFGAGEVLGSLAPSIDVLVAGRVLAGIGGAAMMPAGVSALRLQIPEQRLVSAMAVWGAGAMGGVAVGGIVAGLLLKVASWRGALWPLAIAAAIGFVIAAVTLEDRRVEHPQQLKPVWNIGLALGLGGVVWGLTQAGSHGWGSVDPLLPVLLGVGASAGTAVLAVPELRRTALGVDLPRIGVAFAAVITANVGVVALGFFLTIWLQRVAGWSALGAAVLLLPFFGLSAVTALYSGKLIGRFGKERVLVASFVFELVGLLGLMRLDRSTPYGEIVPFLILTGIGLALSLTALAMVLLGSAPADRGGLMSGLQVSANQIGGVLAIALLGAIVASSVGPRYADGLAQAGLPRSVPASVRSGLGQGIAPDGAPQHALGLQAFSQSVGVALTIGAGASGLGLLLSLWLVRRQRRQPATA